MSLEGGLPQQVGIHVRGAAIESDASEGLCVDGDDVDGPGGVAFDGLDQDLDGPLFAGVVADVDCVHAFDGESVCVCDESVHSAPSIHGGEVRFHTVQAVEADILGVSVICAICERPECWFVQGVGRTFSVFVARRRVLRPRSGERSYASV